MFKKEQMEKKRNRFYITAKTDLKQPLRRKAFEENTTMFDLTSRALEIFLEKEAKHEKT